MMATRTKKSLPAPLLSLAFLFLSLPAHGQVRFDQKPDRIAIEIDGKPFSVLHYGKAVGKPYLHPIMTASGKAVTRGFPDDPQPGDPTDRPHLRGLIIGVERLTTAAGGTQDFWENDPAPYYAKRPKGAIVVQEATPAADGPDRGTISMVNHWISKEGQLWVVERRRFTFYSKPADSRMIDVDLEIEARENLKFEDDKDNIISLRLALPFSNHMEGRLMNATGGVNEAGVKGHRSPWVDWVADLGGEKVGVAVFDHPSNRNYPNRWHAKDFGQINLGPFGGKNYAEYPTADPKAHRDDWSLTLKPGEKLNLRYRVLIHPAEGTPAGQLVSDLERLLDQAGRPPVDLRVYATFKEWTGMKKEWTSLK